MTYYAKIESDVVVCVECVTTQFFENNPSRYTGTWKKVNQGEAGVGSVYLPSSDKIIPPKPFDSWTVVDDEWTPPSAKPGDDYYWDEGTLTWKEL